MGYKGPAAATAHNTHCGRGWINSSEDGTLWCNPRPRIMEHRNLKDNTLSEQWAQEPRRGRAERNGDSRHFPCKGLSSILRRRRAETHSGFILTENEAVCGNKKGEGEGRQPRSSLHFTSAYGPTRGACKRLHRISFAFHEEANGSVRTFKFRGKWRSEAVESGWCTDRWWEGFHCVYLTLCVLCAPARCGAGLTGLNNDKKIWKKAQMHN